MNQFKHRQHQQPSGLCSNNTNKLSPQEQWIYRFKEVRSSNNTNKLSPQELGTTSTAWIDCSNNTNKLSPQEQLYINFVTVLVQIIQINLALKNLLLRISFYQTVQIIQINLALKNRTSRLHAVIFRSNNTNKLSPQERELTMDNVNSVQIIQINLALKNYFPLILLHFSFK